MKITAAICLFLVSSTLALPTPIKREFVDATALEALNNLNALNDNTVLSNIANIGDVEVSDAVKDIVNLLRKRSAVLVDATDAKDAVKGVLRRRAYIDLTDAGVANDANVVNDNTVLSNIANIGDVEVSDAVKDIVNLLRKRSAVLVDATDAKDAVKGVLRRRTYIDLTDAGLANDANVVNDNTVLSDIANIGDVEVTDAVKYIVDLLRKRSAVLVDATDAKDAVKGVLRRRAYIDLTDAGVANDANVVNDNTVLSDIANISDVEVTDAVKYIVDLLRKRSAVLVHATDAKDAVKGVLRRRAYIDLTAAEVANDLNAANGNTVLSNIANIGDVEVSDAVKDIVNLLRKRSAVLVDATDAKDAVKGVLRRRALIDLTDAEIANNLNAVNGNTVLSNIGNVGDVNVEDALKNILGILGIFDDNEN
ncbi:hypothetical protein Unana1_06951 [Umbelopsis nana]